MKGPILITGAYRSGSTLLAQMLNAHPQLVIPYDKAHFFRFYLDEACPLEDNYKRILDEAKERFKIRFDIEIPYDRIVSKIEQGGNISLGRLYETFMLETFHDGSSNVRWGEKTLLQCSNIPLFLQMFEESQAIHIIRDPRDVLASKREMTWEKPYHYLNAVFVCLYSMNWAKTKGSVISGTRYKIVIYEELIKEPEKKIREICEFLKIPFNEDLIEPKSFKDGKGDQWKSNTAFGDIKEGISSRPSERWKKALEKWEILFTESILGHLLDTFGYKLSNMEFNSTDLACVWERIRETPIIQGYLQHWFSTGEGIECHSSDPRNKDNWSKHKLV